MFQRLVEKLFGRGWAYRTAWIFCGHRKPWVEITNSNEILIRLKQINVVSFPKLTIHYEAYDLKLYIHYSELFDINKVKMPYIPTFVIGRESISELLTIRFHVVAQPGESIAFTHSICKGCEGIVVIYDGLDFYYKLLELKLKSENVTNINKFTKYFHAQIFVTFLSVNEIGHHEWKLKLSRKVKSYKMIRKVQNLTVDNIKSDKVANYVYRVHLENDQFPQISIIRRQFDGFNENRCICGGILLTEFISTDTKENNTFGPYCPDFLSKQPLLTPDGLRSVTFPNRQIQIVIYGFSPLFTVDIDLIISANQCEGIVNPSNVCNNAFNRTIKSGITRFNKRLKKLFYKFYCMEKIYTTYTELFIYIYSIRGCVIIQELQVEVNNAYNVKIYSLVNVHLNIYTWIDDDDIRSRTYWNSVRFHLSTDYYWSKSGSKDRILYDIPSIHIENIIKGPARTVGYFLKLTDSMSLEPKCYSCNESSHNLWKRPDVRGRYILVVSALCVSGYYHKNYIYVFTLDPLYEMVINRDHKLLVYLSIATSLAKRCTTANTVSNNETDQVTTYLRGISISTLQVTKSSYTLTIRELQQAVIYQKNNNCSMVVIQFRYVNDILVTMPFMDVLLGLLIRVRNVQNHSKLYI